jgi:hypothetical protein
MITGRYGVQADQRPIVRILLGARTPAYLSGKRNIKNAKDGMIIARSALEVCDRRVGF